MVKAKTPQEIAREELLQNEVRNKLLLEQSKLMLEIINNHANNHEVLKKELEAIKLKPDAIKLAINCFLKPINTELNITCR